MMNCTGVATASWKYSLCRKCKNVSVGANYHQQHRQQQRSGKHGRDDEFETEVPCFFLPLLLLPVNTEFGSTLSPISKGLDGLYYVGYLYLRTVILYGSLLRSRGSLPRSGCHPSRRVSFSILQHRPHMTFPIFSVFLSRSFPDVPHRTDPRPGAGFRTSSADMRPHPRIA